MVRELLSNAEAKTAERNYSMIFMRVMLVVIFRL